MNYQLTIRKFDSGLNELLNGVHYDYKTKRISNHVKAKNDKVCIEGIRIARSLRGVKIEKPIVIWYSIYAKDKRRDRMNIASAFDKSFEDALQKAGIIKNDGWNDVLNVHYEFYIDAHDPRVEITIMEIENENCIAGWN